MEGRICSNWLFLNLVGRSGNECWNVQVFTLTMWRFEVRGMEVPPAGEVKMNIEVTSDQEESEPSGERCITC